jgi:hypothetical protein
MKALGRASLRFQKPGYLAIQAIFPAAHFGCVNNRSGLAWSKPIVGSARHAENGYRYELQRTRDFFCRIEKHASELHATTSIAVSDAAGKPLIQIIKSLNVGVPKSRSNGATEGRRVSSS